MGKMETTTPVMPRPTTTTTGGLMTRVVLIAGGFLCMFGLINLATTHDVGSLHARLTLQSPSTPSVMMEWPAALRSVMSDDTLAVLSRDSKLRQTYAEVVGIGAETARALAKRYNLDGLRLLGRDLDAHLDDVGRDALTKRQGLLDSISGALGLGGTSTSGAGGIGGLVGSITDSLTSSVSGAAQGAGLFLGVGIGQGVAQGSNLATPDKANTLATKVITDNHQTPGGINGAIQNAALGATSMLITTVMGSNTSSTLVSGALDTAMQQAAPALLGLGQGIGGGTAMGLGLTRKQLAPPTNTTAIPAILGNFGFGLTNTLMSAIDLQTLSSLVNAAGGGGSAIMAQLPAGAMGLGSGLGGGAAQGLGLTQRNTAPSQTGSDLGTILNNFGFGLSKAVTDGLNTTQLLGTLGSITGSGGGGLDTAALLKQLPSAASGLGKGLGSGAAIGLGLQPDEAVPVAQMPDGSIDVGGVVRGFSQSLTSSFLANGTIGKVLADNAGTALSLASNVDVGKMAMGLGVGLVQGINDGIDSIGGIEAILNGTSKPPSNGQMKETPVTFNDSVGGAVTGFGQGLTSQGTITVRRLLGNVTSLNSLLGQSPSSSPSPSQGQPQASQPPSTGQQQAKAQPGNQPVGSAQPPSSAQQPDYAKGALQPAPANGAGRLAETPTLPPGTSSLNITHLTPRSIEARDNSPITAMIDTLGKVNLSLVLTSDTISSMSQSAVDALSCEGVGGMSLVGYGLVKSGFIDFALTGQYRKIFKTLMPHGTIRIVSRDTIIEIEGQRVADAIPLEGTIGIGDALNAANGLSINGNKVLAMVGFLVIHIAFSVVILLSLLPLVMGAESIYNLWPRYVRSQPPKWLTKVPTLNNFAWGLLIGPSFLIIFIFGAVVFGKAPHFRSAHALFGLLTTLAGLGASALHFLFKLREPKPSLDVNPNSFTPMSKLAWTRMFSNQMLLQLVSFTSLLGFRDLNSIAVCTMSVVPFEVLIGIGFSLAPVMFIGQTIVTLEGWIAWRDRKRVATVGQPVPTETWGGDTEKIYISRPQETSPSLRGPSRKKSFIRSRWSFSRRTSVDEAREI